MTRMHRHIDRRRLFASGAAATLLAATGVSAGLSPVRGGRLCMAVSGATRTDVFDPRVTQGLFMQVAMVGMAFDTLTEVGADGTLRGELVTGWRGGADARVWEFDLREDVFFHNGDPFSARDVVASFALHRETMLRNIDTITMAGETRLQITLKTPNADFPYLLSAPQLVIYPADHIAQAMEQGIGTGLYRLHRFLPGRQVIGQKVDSHYKDGTAGWFDVVELVSIPSDQVRAEALRDGFVDAVDLSSMDLLQGSEAVKLLPDVRQISCAVREKIHVPAFVGACAPLDNLRAAERWWRG